MKTTRRRAAALIAAGALGIAGLAVAAPALAGTNPFGDGPSAGSDVGPHWRGGDGMMDGPGRGDIMRARDRDGTCHESAVTASQGTLTDEQKATLVAMAQEEKLAHDLYAAFADKYSATIFDRIAAAEARHLDAVRVLIDRYGLTDPTNGMDAGQFSDPSMQATYGRLLAEGLATQAAALQVGEEVERSDIAELQSALDGLDAPDVRQVYLNLLAATERHLTAFERW